LLTGVGDAVLTGISNTTMIIHRFPYSGFPALEIPDSCKAAFYALPENPVSATEREMVKTALDAPIGCGRLGDEVKRGMRITVAVDDNSRSSRTELMLPMVLSELEDAGIPKKDICIFIALGTHRWMTGEEIERKYTPGVAADYRFVNPDGKDTKSYVSIGQSARGFAVKMHTEILKSDFVIGVGQTIPHMIAGFGGGGKIINPGCADAGTIGEMHWLCNEVPEGRLFGVRDNLVRETIDEAALESGLRFILNEVPGGGSRLAGAFAGHPVLAHRQACDFAGSVCTVKIKEKADIVIADAYPADLDFWQALKGLNAAYGAVKDGGIVILVTPCTEGTSVRHRELTAIGYIPVEQMRAMVRRGGIDKCVAANLLLGRQLLDRAQAILVTKGISEKDTKAMGFGWAPDAAMALRQAITRHGNSASINILYKAAKMICKS
jgi:nickel-dependent lactate racemase